MIKVKVKINEPSRRRVEGNLKTYMTSRSREALQDVLNDIKTIARYLAPKDTGDTARMLYSRVYQVNNGFKGIVGVSNSTQGGTNRAFPQYGKYKNFNLPRWMHETGGIFRSDNPFGKAGTKHIKSGDPYFLYTATNQVRQDLNNRIKKKFR